MLLCPGLSRTLRKPDLPTPERKEMAISVNTLLYLHCVPWMGASYLNLPSSADVYSTCVCVGGGVHVLVSIQLRQFGHQA